MKHLSKKGGSLARMRTAFALIAVLLLASAAQATVTVNAGLATAQSTTSAPFAAIHRGAGTAGSRPCFHVEETFHNHIPTGPVLPRDGV